VDVGWGARVGAGLGGRSLYSARGPQRKKAAPHPTMTNRAVVSFHKLTTTLSYHCSVNRTSEGPYNPVRIWRTSSLISRIVNCRPLIADPKQTGLN
jgi:hypothetical protein